MILSIDEVNDILDDFADTIPEALFEGLNGGVNLLEEAVPDPEFPEGEMYILGEYLDDRDEAELEEFRREYGLN